MKFNPKVSMLSISSNEDKLFFEDALADKVNDEQSLRLRAFELSNEITAMFRVLVRWNCGAAGRHDAGDGRPLCSHCMLP